MPHAVSPSPSPSPLESPRAAEPAEQTAASSSAPTPPLTNNDNNNTSTHPATTRPPRNMSWRECPDPFLEDIIFVDKLPSDAWAEGMAVRPSGQVLATRLDGAELYNLVSLTETMEFGVKQEPPHAAHRFPGANTVFSVAALTGGDPDLEEYAVVTCKASYDPYLIENVVCWRVSYTREAAARPDSYPAVSKIADIPGGGFCLGLEVVSDDVLLIADASEFCHRRVRISTGEADVLFQHLPSMKPLSDQEQWSSNRLRLAGGFLWYTNVSTGHLYRVPVDRSDDGSDVRIAGTPQTIADGFGHANGLALNYEPGEPTIIAYVTGWVEGTLWRVDIDMATGKSNKTLLFDDLVRPTATQLTWKDGSSKPTLYLVCCGAMAASFLDSEYGPAMDLLGVDKAVLPIEVLITTEVTVTYETADGY